MKLDYRPRQLARLIRQEAEKNPVIKGMYALEGSSDLESGKLKLVPNGLAGWLVCEAPDEPCCSVEVGPASSGSFVFATIEPSFVAKGESPAGKLASLFAYAAEVWSMDIPNLIPSPDLERETN